MPDSVALRLETATPIFTGPNWDYTALRRVYDAVERIALDEIGLDVYPVQVEHEEVGDSEYFCIRGQGLAVARAVVDGNHDETSLAER